MTIASASSVASSSALRVATASPAPSVASTPAPAVATAVPHSCSPPAPSLARLVALTSADMADVNDIISERVQSSVAMIPDLAGHLIMGGGKRLRPMLTLAMGRLLSCSDARLCQLAAVVEFIHTATLLHDDVVDSSDMRRGRKTANHIWGNSAPILVGDFLFSRAFELMVAAGSQQSLAILSRASRIIAEGEVSQLSLQHRVDTSEHQYLEIINAKTAELFAAACRIAAVVAEKDSQIEESLDSYGRNLGMAFQLVDDVLDYDSPSDVMGKNTGDDFREGKLTLPIILAYQRGGAEEREFWYRAIAEQSAGKANSAEDFEHAKHLLAECDALSDVLAIARAYGQQARAALEGFPDSEARVALREAVDFAIARAY